MRKLRKKSERTIIKKKIIYEAQRCTGLNRFGKRCKKFATGNGTRCIKHGGIRNSGKELMSVHDISVGITLSKFNPAVHPIQYIELSREGKSHVEIAAEMEIDSKVLTKWADKFKEFNVAYEIGKAMHEAWWIEQGKSNLTNTRFQTGLYKFLTTNKLGYAEKIETKSHNINENVGVLLVPGKMSVEEWENQNKKDDDENIEAEFTEIT